jgi:hypothetical protein
MTTINRQSAIAIGKEIKSALQEVAERNGMTVDWRGVTYNVQGTVKPRVELKTDTADRSEFATYATDYGLAPGDFGAEFKSNGRLFRISGVSPRSPKRPILCEEVGTGRTFKFTPAGVTRALGKSW